MEKNGPIPEKIIKKYSKQLLEGLHYLHEKNVIHKDLKGANLLVDADGTVKLADFGCSTEIEKTLTKVKDIASNPLKGSIPWMAPEVVTEVGYGRRSDIWSFGCTILEMATGKIPWSHVKVNTPIDLLMKIAL
jgi:serine/threonine protein kinase